MILAHQASNIAVAYARSDLGWTNPSALGARRHRSGRVVYVLGEADGQTRQAKVLVSNAGAVIDETEVN